MTFQHKKVDEGWRETDKQNFPSLLEMKWRIGTDVTKYSFVTLKHNSTSISQLPYQSFPITTRPWLLCFMYSFVTLTQELNSLEVTEKDCIKNWSIHDYLAYSFVTLKQKSTLLGTKMKDWKVCSKIGPSTTFLNLLFLANGTILQQINTKSHPSIVQFWDSSPRLLISSLLP